MWSAGRHEDHVDRLHLRGRLDDGRRRPARGCDPHGASDSCRAAPCACGLGAGPLHGAQQTSGTCLQLCFQIVACVRAQAASRRELARYPFLRGHRGPLPHDLRKQGHHGIFRMYRGVGRDTSTSYRLAGQGSKRRRAEIRVASQSRKSRVDISHHRRHVFSFAFQQPLGATRDGVLRSKGRGSHVLSRRCSSSAGLINVCRSARFRTSAHGMESLGPLHEEKERPALRAIKATSVAAQRSERPPEGHW
mmetsp:Transcript_65754/g.116749  ORF Transcript_65754/g.116749 Transcript_65754/m.116749 type:complete len:249 (+) Transcript_65754:30-776(+)